ncbi:MAG: hypothetical protein NTY77_14650 [Elusimicrobia bacterium]|nr:hypothetical protein [Elusimicrobiota bacterium]
MSILDSRKIPFKLLGLIAGAGLLLLFVWMLHIGGSRDGIYPQDDYIFLGDHLFHRFQDSQASWHMPLYGNLRAILNQWAFAETDITKCCLVAVYILALAAGLLLGGGPCALLAGLGISGLYHYGYLLEAHDIQQFFSSLVVLTAGLLIWRAQALSYGRSLLLGLALGVGLLCRSTLVFFPPMLVAFEWLAERKPLRAYWKHALILLIVPYLFLLPFIRMNWQLRKEFVAVEYGQCDGNIIPGALGIVGTPEGNFKVLADRPLEHSEVLGWAVRETLRHPWRYLAGYVKRVALVISWTPLLFFLALLGWWRGRSKPEIAQLSFLALYFPALYCSMSIQAHYFKPFWLLLCLLAAYGLTSWLAAGWTRADRRISRLMTGAILLFLGGLLVLSGHTEWVVGTYAGNAVPISGAALDAAIQRHPRDSCLWYERGLLRLKEGSVGAAEDFKRAVELCPYESKYRLALALVEGRWRGAPSECLKDRGDVLLMQAVAELKKGRRAEAREHIEAAMAEYDSSVYIQGRRADETAFQQRLQAANSEFMVGVYPLLLTVIRPQEALALLREMASVRPGQAAVLLEEARLAARAGDRKLALESLARVQAAKLDPQDQSRMRGLYASLGEHRAPLAMLQSRLKSSPENSRLWLEQAGFAARAGDRGLALASLARVQAAKLDPQDRFEMRGLYADLGEYHAPLAMLQSRLKDSPEDPRLWLEQADFAARAGDRKLALESLANAQKGKLDPRKARSAGPVQDLQDLCESGRVQRCAGDAPGPAQELAG